MKYFKTFPYSVYTFGTDDEAFTIRDIFKKISLLEYLEDSPNLFTTYRVNDGDRPDTVAHKLYGDSNLHWVVLFASSVVDPKDWLMDAHTFEQYIAERYDNPYTLSHYLQNGEVYDNRAAQLLVNVGDNPFGTVDSDPDPTVYTTVEVTAYDNEVASNDKRRLIRVIHPRHLNAFIEDVRLKLRGS